MNQENQRRKFIYHSGWAALGTLLLPSALASCTSDLDDLSKNFYGKVIIIGAGAAGLYAGYLLKSKGIAFEILEASPKTGGRMGRLDDFVDFPVDLGAQWLHGNNSILGDLILNKQVKMTLDNSEEYFLFQNQITQKLPKDIAAIFDNEDAPDMSFAEYARKKGFSDDYQYIVEQIAGDQGAGADLLSVKNNALEENNWAAGDDDFKFEETFFDVIQNHLAAELTGNIHLNTAVKTIDYTSDQIRVVDSDDNEYLADKVIITVPITILKDGDITFNPSLPARKTEAFAKLGMGAGMKVFLNFSEKFYVENLSGGKICAAYADESLGKTGSDHVLLAFVMGPQAEYLTGLGSNDAIISALLTELDEIYEGKATSSFIKGHVQNWTTEPFIRGAYSYSTVGMGNARSIAAESVNNKLFFAGEAMNLNGHHQTVHGAVETGYREVINIIKNA